MTHDARDAVTDENAGWNSFDAFWNVLNPGIRPTVEDVEWYWPAIKAALAAHPSNTTPFVYQDAGDVRDKGDSAEDRAEQFIQAAIDSAPEPLRRLGEWLANVLDDDQWKTADRMITGAAVSLAAALKPSDAPYPVKAEMLAVLKMALKTALDEAEARNYDPPANTRMVAELEFAIARAEGRA